MRQKGLIPIAGGKRIDWNAVRAEYIAGGASYRSLAEKHGVSKDMIARKAKAEKWERDRATVRDKAATKIIQKTADVVADNATIAAEIQRILLRRLLKEAQNLPDLIGTELHQDMTTLSYGDKDGAKGKVTKRTDGGKRYKLTDLTRAYKDLTEDMPKGDGADVEDLNPLVELLKG